MDMDALVSRLLQDDDQSARPSVGALERMANMCYATLLSNGNGTMRRADLGNVLRRAMGAEYQKGWVNHALAELERLRIGRLTGDRTFFSITRGPVDVTLVVDGPYFEWTQRTLLQGHDHAFVVDLRAFVEKLETDLSVRFAHKVYVHDTPTAFHYRMLGQRLGFAIDASPHALGRLEDYVKAVPGTVGAFRSLVLLTGGRPQLASSMRWARKHLSPFPRQVLGGMALDSGMRPFVCTQAETGVPFWVESILAASLVSRSTPPPPAPRRMRRRKCNFGRWCRYLYAPDDGHRQSHLEKYKHVDDSLHRAGIAAFPVQDWCHGCLSSDPSQSLSSGPETSDEDSMSSCVF
jgi:hypothetical protein